MVRSQAPAHVESLIREYLRGSRLLPLSSSSQLHRHQQAKAPAASKQLTLRRPAGNS
jgi:hypothetical protein